jgi:hypothetical protein
MPRRHAQEALVTPCGQWGYLNLVFGTKDLHSWVGVIGIMDDLWSTKRLPVGHTTVGLGWPFPCRADAGTRS